MTGGTRCLVSDNGEVKQIVGRGRQGVSLNLLFGVTPTDPLTFAGVALLLMFVALLACWILARRAAKVAPVVALRQD